MLSIFFLLLISLPMVGMQYHEQDQKENADKFITEKKELPQYSTSGSQVQGIQADLQLLKSSIQGYPELRGFENNIQTIIDEIAQALVIDKSFWTAIADKLRTLKEKFSSNLATRSPERKVIAPMQQIDAIIGKINQIQ